jgi:Zn-dependent alcohol dehydrogenase
VTAPLIGTSGTSTPGIVEEVGNDVQTIRPGQFVVGSF